MTSGGMGRSGVRSGSRDTSYESRDDVYEKWSGKEAGVEDVSGQEFNRHL